MLTVLTGPMMSGREMVARRVQRILRRHEAHLLQGPACSMKRESSIQEHGARLDPEPHQLVGFIGVYEEVAALDRLQVDVQRENVRAAVVSSWGTFENAARVIEAHIG